MHTYKTIYRTCDCGNMNQVYQAHTVHKRIQRCPVCNDFSVKSGYTMTYMNRVLPVYEWADFEKFALAWG